jgi:hypothetical protein
MVIPRSGEKFLLRRVVQEGAGVEETVGIPMAACHAPRVDSLKWPFGWCRAARCDDLTWPCLPTGQGSCDGYDLTPEWLGDGISAVEGGVGLRYVR